MFLILTWENVLNLIILLLHLLLTTLTAIYLSVISCWICFFLFFLMFCYYYFLFSHVYLVNFIQFFLLLVLDRNSIQNFVNISHLFNIDYDHASLHVGQCTHTSLPTVNTYDVNKWINSDVETRLVCEKELEGLDQDFRCFYVKYCE